MTRDADLELEEALGDFTEVEEEPSSSTDLAVRQVGGLFQTDDPALVVEQATRTADVLKDVLQKKNLITRIGTKEYVLAEGWTLLGSMLGCTVATAWTREIDGGFEARVEVTNARGVVIGAAEAMCTRKESAWKNRDDNQIRSMAQTRAMAKALRMPLGFIVVLAGYQATPPEEISDVAASTDARPVAAKILVAELRSVLEELKDDPRWLEEAVVKNGNAKWGTNVKKLDGFSSDQIKLILEAAQKAAA